MIKYFLVMFAAIPMLLASYGETLRRASTVVRAPIDIPPLVEVERSQLVAVGNEIAGSSDRLLASIVNPGSSRSEAPPDLQPMTRKLFDSRRQYQAAVESARAAIDAVRLLLTDPEKPVEGATPPVVAAPYQSLISELWESRTRRYDLATTARRLSTELRAGRTVDLEAFLKQLEDHVRVTPTDEEFRDRSAAELDWARYEGEHPTRDAETLLGQLRRWSPGRSTPDPGPWSKDLGELDALIAKHRAVWPEDHASHVRRRLTESIVALLSALRSGDSEDEADQLIEELAEFADQSDLTDEVNAIAHRCIQSL